MLNNLDTSWIDDWFPSIDGIRAKSVREKAIPAFIQEKIDGDGEDEEGSKKKKAKDVKK